MAFEGDWRRAATEVERRLNELRMDRTALAKAADIDRKTVDNFLTHGRKPRVPTRGGIEAALGWAPGSLNDLATGGTPRPVGSSGITESDVLDWLTTHLPAHLADHIVNQYFILKSTAASGAPPPPDPIQGPRAAKGVREAPSQDRDDPDPVSPRNG